MKSNKLPLIFVAIVAPFVLALGVQLAVAAQPKEDAVVLDKDGCSVDVSWVDGMETAQKVTISYDGVVSQTITIDDIVGDQSRKLVTLTAAEGTSIRVRLYVEGEIADEKTTTITKCPTATPTSVPATATPAPAATATPIPPIPTPIVIVTEKIVEVPVKVSPPSTGSAGLAAPADWDYGGGWDGGDGGFYAYFGW